MTAVEATTANDLDAALDAIVREREWTLACTKGLDQAVRLAELYLVEARLWSTVFERVRIRLYWRAALAAEGHARIHARHWRNVAAERGVDASAWPGPVSGAV